MKQPLSPATVLILALIAVVVPVAAIEVYVLRHTGGTFLYPLDDTFIHMALARNLSFHGNWGMNPFAFASASSSVLFTLLLAVSFKIFSVHTIIPFVINCIVAVFLLVVVRRWLEREGISVWGQLVILLGIIFLTPVPILVVCGMEHTLQCLFSFLFVFGFAGWLERSLWERPAKWRLPWPVVVYGVMVTFVRYEGLFLIAIACLILAWHRKWALGFRLGLISVLPLVIFGAWSVAKGSYFLPNSVLLKSESAPLSVSALMKWLDTIFVQKLTIVKTDGLPAGTPRPGISLLATQRLLIILPLVYLAFLKFIHGGTSAKSGDRERKGDEGYVARGVGGGSGAGDARGEGGDSGASEDRGAGGERPRVAYGYILIILLACTVLQLCFASTGWLYRYEAYLVFCTSAIVGLLVWKYARPLAWRPGQRGTSDARGAERPAILRWMLAVVVFAAAFPFVLRSAAAFSKTGTACVNIYQQQYQMGRFLHTYYDRDVNAVNDIGAVSYLTGGANIDLWGLGNIDVARSRKSGRWSPAFLDSLCRSQHAETAVLYEKWFSDSLLHRWTKVATWGIANNVICGDDTVSFFSIRPSDAPALRSNLEAFQKQLPAGVTVEYY